MITRLPLLLLLAALMAAGTFFFLRSGGDAGSSTAEGDRELAEGPTEQPRKDGRTLIPKTLPGKEPGDGTAADEPTVSRFKMQIAAEPALSGIEVQPATDDDRKRAGVTGQYGSGVTITSIHPDSSAAEVSLEIGDVIVRAQKENVSSVEDLRRIVGDRDHTVVNFMRQGQLLSVVLQKPFTPKK